MSNIGLCINKRQQIMKRVFDVIFSFTAIIILSPLLLLISLLVLITSGRPIFYLQNRVGKDRKQFRLIKFRSMVKNADELKVKMFAQNEATFPYFKIKNDSRITPIGKFLRKTSLDELPQLFNVLKGDMSIVGVRPVLPEEAVHLEDFRFTAEAGITGATQLYRDKKLSLKGISQIEKEYIHRKHKFWGDILIIFKTFRVVFKGE